MSAIEERIKVVQAESELTRDAPYPRNKPDEERPGRTRSVVQSVRLPANEFLEIERIAREADVPVSSLIRGWVLAALAAERGTSLRDAVDRLVADADHIRRLTDHHAA